MALSKVDENGNIVILPDIVEKKTFEKNEESHETLSKHDAYSLLDDVRVAFEGLLIEAMSLYLYNPNNYRKAADEYFKEEIELQKKLSDHFS